MEPTGVPGFIWAPRSSSIHYFVHTRSFGLQPFALSILTQEWFSLPELQQPLCLHDPYFPCPPTQSTFGLRADGDRIRSTQLARAADFALPPHLHRPTKA